MRGFKLGTAEGRDHRAMNLSERLPISINQRLRSALMNAAALKALPMTKSLHQEQRSVEARLESEMLER